MKKLWNASLNLKGPSCLRHLHHHAGDHLFNGQRMSMIDNMKLHNDVL